MHARVALPLLAASLCLSTACGSLLAAGTHDTIGPSGGTAWLADGAWLKIPPGVLTAKLDVSLGVDPSDAPPWPQNATRIGQIHTFSPDGQTFAHPVTVHLPAKAGGDAVLFARVGNGWVAVPTVPDGDGYSADVSRLTYYAVGMFDGSAGGDWGAPGDGGASADGGGPDGGPWGADGGPWLSDAGPGDGGFSWPDGGCSSAAQVCSTAPQLTRGIAYCGDLSLLEANYPFNSVHDPGSCFPGASPDYADQDWQVQVTAGTTYTVYVNSTSMPDLLQAYALDPGSCAASGCLSGAAPGDGGPFQFSFTPTTSGNAVVVVGSPDFSGAGYDILVR